MLVVSSLQAAGMTTVAGLIFAVLFQVDRFNDHTDGRSRRPN